MRLVPLVALLLLLAPACGDEGAASGDGARVVVTTSVLGDVVEEVLGDAADVEVLIPPGADPHEVQLSARQVNDMRTADAIVANGAGLEVGLLDALEAAEADGVPVYEAISAVSTLEAGESVHHPHDEEEPHEAEEGDGHSHGTGDVDPHFFTDPDRMADAVAGLTEFLAAEVPALDTPAVRQRASAYEDELHALATEVEETLASIPPERRVMVTNHDVFGYFADRFDLEVVGVVVPGGGTQGAAVAADLQHLVEDVEAAGVDVVFTDASSSADLAETLADEAGGLSVVPLLTESLAPEGEDGDTYVGMVTLNAGRIADALVRG